MIRTNPSGRLTVERMIGMPLAKAARRQVKAAIDIIAQGSVARALAESPAHLKADTAAAHIDAWVAVLAAERGKLEAATHLAAVEGRLAPGIETTDRRAAAETAFAGPA